VQRRAIRSALMSAGSDADNSDEIDTASAGQKKEGREANLGYPRDTSHNLSDR
jgi:hypothetical protein